MRGVLKRLLEMDISSIYMSLCKSIALMLIFHLILARETECRLIYLFALLTILPLGEKKPP